MVRIYKHKHRGWQVRYLVYAIDGTNIERYRYRATKEKGLQLFLEAQALEYELLKNDFNHDRFIYYCRLGLLNPDDDAKVLKKSRIHTTLDELSRIVLARSKAECRPLVHATNRGRINKVLDYFGTIPISEITRDRIEAYRTERIAAGLMPATVNKEINKLAQILDVALAGELISSNPARAMKPLKDKRGRVPRALTKEEVCALMSACDKHPELLLGHSRVMMATYLYTGMRRQELTYLQVEDVDLTARHIRIQASADPEGFITKSRKARVIGIAASLVPILKPYMDKGGIYVFGGDQILIHPNSITRAFRVLADEAKFPPSITLHSLRHTYITHLIDAGVSPRRVQYLAGHARFSTTEKYLHVLPSDQIAEDVLDFGV